MRISEKIKAWLCDIILDFSLVFLKSGYFIKEDVCIQPQTIPFNLTVISKDSLWWTDHTLF